MNYATLSKDILDFPVCILDEKFNAFIKGGYHVGLPTRKCLEFCYNAFKMIREFEIIGEASKYLLREEILTTKYRSYRSVVDFRNVIIYEYFGIDPDEVWDVLEQSIPPFRKVIEEIIAEIPLQLKGELLHAYIEDNHYLDFVVKALRNLEE